MMRNGTFMSFGNTEVVQIGSLQRLISPSIQIEFYGKSIF